MRDAVRVFLWLTILCVPIENMLVLPGVGTVSRVVGLLACVCAGIVLFLSGRMRRLTAFHTLLALYLLWNVVSLVWSIDPEFSRLRLSTLLQLAVLVWLMWEFTERPEHQRRLMQAYVLGASIAAVGTLMAFYAGREVTYMRFAAAGFDPNDLCVILSLGIPLAWYLAVTERWKWLCVGYCTYLPLALFAAVLTASRGGLLACVVACAFVALMVPRLSPGVKLTAVFLLVATAGILVTQIPPSSLERLASVGREIASGSMSERRDIWQSGLQVFWRHSLLGVGVGGFSASNYKLNPHVPTGVVAHNSFLSIMVELGIIGLILFVLAIVAAGKMIRTYPPMAYVLWLVMLLTWAVGAFSLTFEHRKPTWVIFGLLAGHSVAVTWGRSPQQEKQY
jgi:O-antigen ligase